MTVAGATYETVFVRRRYLAKSKVDGQHRTKMPEYRAWAGMLTRCYNPKNKAFGRYGGRGISVCDRWREDFENFYRDMGPRPSAKHSIDRENNDGNYEPSNCRWATPREQVLNRGAGVAVWSEVQIATLKRMYLSYRPVEEIAIALDRTVGTIRLRIHKLRLRREAHITRLVKKHGELHPILAERGQDEFLAEVDKKVRAENSRSNRQFEDKKQELATKMADILSSSGSRNEKIRLMRMEGASLSAIGRKFGITRERVRQIESSGFPEMPANPAGRDRKITKTNPRVLRKKVNRLCRAWNAASREARILFMHAAPDAVFDDLSADRVLQENSTPSPTTVRGAA